jgi:hypothetical protein
MLESNIVYILPLLEPRRSLNSLTVCYTSTFQTQNQTHTTTLPVATGIQVRCCNLLGLNNTNQTAQTVQTAYILKIPKNDRLNICSTYMEVEKLWNIE